MSLIHGLQSRDTGDTLCFFMSMLVRKGLFSSGITGGMRGSCRLALSRVARSPSHLALPLLDSHTKLGLS